MADAFLTDIPLYSGTDRFGLPRPVLRESTREKHKMSEQTQDAAVDTAVTQEISTETTPAQETNTTTTETTQSTPPTDAAAENWEYNGDRKAIPKPFEKYVKGLDRYVSKKDQALAEARKKAEEYDKLVSSDAYKQMLGNQKPNTGSEALNQPVVTQEEVDAIALGDAKTLEAVIERKAKQLLETNYGPKEQEIKKELQVLTQERRARESAEMVSAFAALHPDFDDLVKSPVGEYMINAVRSGMDLEKVYESAKQIETHYYERFENQRKETFEKKKNGSVVGKSIPGTPDVVFADDENQAKRLAIELTLKGDNRQVQIRKKK